MQIYECSIQGYRKRKRKRDDQYALVASVRKNQNGLGYATSLTKYIIHVFNRKSYYRHNRDDFPKNTSRSFLDAIQSPEQSYRCFCFQ